jgi:hypothetical protein
MGSTPGLDSFQLKANSAQEAIDRIERTEENLNAKNRELADMVREMDRAWFELDRQIPSRKDELDRPGISFTNERAEDATRSKNSKTRSVQVFEGWCRIFRTFMTVLFAQFK